jgi:arginine decarboxylase
MRIVPKRMFFTTGVGKGRVELEAFEAALRDAGIEKLNLVLVSSIFPPHCKVISREQGQKAISPGEVMFTIMARQSTNEPNRLIAASIGVARPSNKDQFGYLSELHTFGQTKKVAGDLAEDLAATMLATTLGLPFDANKAWSEREKVYKSSGLIIESRNITQSAEGDAHGQWTTVIAAAILLPD